MALRRLHGALGSRLFSLHTTCGISSSGPAAAGSPAFFSGQRGFRSSNALFNYYSVLGVSRDANDSEIKKKYYQLAKKYHPDTNQGDPEAAKKFQEVQRAYDTLRDPQKRQAYDGMGHAAYENMEATGGAPGGGPGGPFPGAGFEVDPDELFREFFGGAGRGGGFQGTIFEHMFGGGGGGRAGFGGARMRPRPVVRTAMRVSFEEAVSGTSKLVDLSQLGIPGIGSKAVEINIPAGVDNGFQLRLEGVVPASQGMPAGDLLVNIAVARSPVFQRDEFDLYVDVPIDMVDACLGTSVDVPTIDGSAEVKIKPGTQPGDKLRMRGYGVKMDVVGQRGRRGDQYVTVVLVSQLSTVEAVSTSLRGAALVPCRYHGGGVPEYWGRDSPYHPGTDFLGTPANHLDLVAKRPVSPHVFEITGMQPHYKFPLGAISSITNRATGCMLSVGTGAAAYLALTGDLGASISAFKEAYPLLVFPAKAVVAFPLIYHYMGGLRHIYWDHAKYGNQADKHSVLEVPAVEASSKVLLGGSVAATVLAALYSI
ncbi:hypothetical protein ABPG77_003024 [Micractinium sp. CCAP 211/92]